MINSNEPLVSIITPSYNQGEFIGDTILSVKNQNYSNIEHIIIDGGSTDNTLEIIKKYEGAYNMTWISEKDEGQSDAVNKGFNMAKGEIIGWLNSDDIYIFKDTVEKIVYAFKTNPDAKIIYGDALIINKENVIKRVHITPNFDYRRLLRYCFIVQPSVFFRRDVIKENKLKKELDYAMDYEFWLRLGEKYKFIHVNQIIAADRNHSQRKNLPGHIGVFNEKNFLIKTYNSQERGLEFFVNWVKDRLFIRWLRVKGIKLLLNLYKIKNDFTVDLELEPKLKVLYTQLVGKNSQLF